MGYTKGNWKLNAKQVGIVVCDGSIVADCTHSAFTRETELANAKLIAAAPDLIHALESLLNEYLSIEDADGFKITSSGGIIKARAAIAKAKGE